MSENSKALESTRKCSNCMWWTGKVVGKVAYSGNCKASPPTPVYDGDRPTTVWPRTQHDDWCGSFRMREPGQ